MNLTYVKTWRYDSHTKDVMVIIKDKIKQSTLRKSISNHWLFEPTINYYINRWELNMNPSNRDGINLNSDFIYRIDDSSKVDGFNLLCTFKDINSELFINTETNKK